MALQEICNSHLRRCSLRSGRNEYTYRQITAWPHDLNEFRQFPCYLFTPNYIAKRTTPRIPRRVIQFVETVAKRLSPQALRGRCSILGKLENNLAQRPLRSDHGTFRY